MRTKVFSNGLVVKHRKSAIILENESGKKERESDFVYVFAEEEFLEFVQYLKEAANTSWSNIKPKEADGFGNDYYEYYDRIYDDNGYLKLNGTVLCIEAPYWSRDTLYQFNKYKIQSFLYDLEKRLKLSR